MEVAVQQERIFDPQRNSKEELIADSTAIPS